MTTKVLLAEDSEVVQKGIRRLLATAPDLELVGEAIDYAGATHMTEELKPQVIILDLHRPDESNFTPLDIKSALNHGSLLLAMSIENDEAAKEWAEHIGAVKLLDKMDLFDKLIPAIQHLGLLRANRPV